MRSKSNNGARHKVLDKVYLYGTTYLKHFDSHDTGKATIKEITDPETWLNKGVPEYVVTLNRKRYLIPENTIDETGYLKKTYGKK